MTLRPSTQDVSLAIDVFSVFGSDELAFLHRVYHAFAVQCVWTYSAPSDDPHLKDDAAYLAKVAWVSVRKARKLRAATDAHFIAADGVIRPAHPEWIRISRPARDPLAESTREIARMRGDGRCSYCGSEEGPFEHDHLYPRSRGGSDHPSNIVLACVSCNRSKGNKTLLEWVGSLLPDEWRPNA